MTESTALIMELFFIEYCGTHGEVPTCDNCEWHDPKTGCNNPNNPMGDDERNMTC